MRLAVEASQSPRRRVSTDFLRFWAGQTISNLGSSVTLFALPLLVFKLTGSPLNLGVTSATSFLPYLLFGLVTGAWVDRVDRKRLMIAADVARALLIAAIPVLADTGLLRVGWIYVVAFLLSAGSLVLVRRRFNAERPGANGKPGDERERRAIFRDVADGLRYVLGHPVLRSISAMMAIINFCSAGRLCGPGRGARRARETHGDLVRTRVLRSGRPAPTARTIRSPIDRPPGRQDRRGEEGARRAGRGRSRAELRKQTARTTR